MHMWDITIDYRQQIRYIIIIFEGFRCPIYVLAPNCIIYILIQNGT